MKPAEKISLAQRIHMASPGRGGLPNAVGLCDIDFFEVIGELTGLEEEYQSIYQRRSWRNTGDRTFCTGCWLNPLSPCIWGGSCNKTKRRNIMIYNAPRVIRETSQGIEYIPITDLMLQRREVWLNGEIDSSMADAVISQILYLDAEQPGKEITLYVDSDGGSVSAGLAIYDVMQAVQSSIRTVCIGMAASMAAVIFSAGNRREILKHGEVMIHDPLVSGGISGSALTVQDKSQRLMQLRKILCGILAQHTGKTLKQIYTMTAKDTYFAAEDAVKYGLADTVVEKLERSSV